MARYRSFIAFIIAVCVIALVYWSSPAPVYKPRGLFLPALNYTKHSPVQMQSVRWLPGMPANTHVLGVVSFEYHDGNNDPQKRVQLQRAMQIAAANAGGNALLQQSIAWWPSYSIWVGQAFVLKMAYTR